MKGPPVDQFMSGARKALDDKLRSLGFRPERREGDRDCEVNYRRLQATMRATEDEDAEWLEEACELRGETETWCGYDHAKGTRGI